MISDILTRKGANNIFGSEGKLANIAIQGVKLTDSELEALTMATNMLDDHWKPLSPQQRVSQDKINRAIFFFIIALLIESVLQKQQTLY
jgi:hypothetical protein